VIGPAQLGFDEDVGGELLHGFSPCES